MLPGQPPTFRTPSASERPWWWRFEDATGAEVEVADYADQRFGNQGDAESWVGEIWAELVEHGVEAVSLFELDRHVYGPMSLRA